MKKKNNNKKKKFIIDKYTQSVYPIQNLYICKNYTQKDIDKYFRYTDNCKLDLDFSADAICYTGVADKDNKYCILVLLNDCLFDAKTEYYLERVCAHEAIHAALYMYKYMGQKVSYDNCNEPFAYLNEYIFDCILKTAKK